MIDKIIKESVENRSALIENAAIELQSTKNLPAYLLEKDLWVTFILKVLFTSPNFKDFFEFKGGTSLSKGFDVIKRFSEDIDLIMNWETLGYSSEEMNKDRSNSQQSKFEDEVNQKTEQFIEEKIVPYLSEILNKYNEEIYVKKDEDDNQTIMIKYPTDKQNMYVENKVKLEIGSIAAWAPSTLIKISAYIEDASTIKAAFGNNQLDVIEVETVSVERTFWEKATILHSVANKNKVPARYSRHYYDLYMLAKNQKIKNKAFEQISLLEKVATFKDKFYHTQSAHYEEANKQQLKLVPNNETTIEKIKQDYQKMQDMFFQKPPEFEDILNYLKKLENEIHELGTKS